jgi:tetratricopeptide (TPR) repeat protein
LEPGVKEYLRLSELYSARNEHEKAEKSIKNALEHIELSSPYSKELSALAYNKLSALFHRTQRYDECIENAQKALQYQPTDFHSYIYIGVCYHEKGDFDNAIAHSKKALQFNPFSADAYYNLGLSYYALGDFAKAEASFKATLRLNRKYKPAMAWLKRMDKENLLKIPLQRRKKQLGI